MSASEKPSLPPCDKSCEAPGCHATAIGFTAFELALPNGMHSVLPYQWRCSDHARFPIRMSAEEWQRARDAFHRRHPGESLKKMVVGLTNLSIDEVAELRQLTEVLFAEAMPTVPKPEVVPIQELIDLGVTSPEEIRKLTG